MEVPLQAKVSISSEEIPLEAPAPPPQYPERWFSVHGKSPKSNGRAGVPEPLNLSSTSRAAGSPQIALGGVSSNGGVSKPALQPPESPRRSAIPPDSPAGRLAAALAKVEALADPVPPSPAKSGGKGESNGAPPAMVPPGKGGLALAGNLNKASPTSVQSNLQSPSSKKDALIAEARAMVAGLLEAIDEDRNNTNNDPNLAFSRNPLKAFSTSEAVSIEKFVSSGGLRSIVVATIKHCNSSDAVDFGCKSLSAFCLYNNGLLPDMVNFGAVDSVISAIKAQVNGKHETASVSALKMLRNLTQSSESREAIFQRGGLAGVVATMEARADDARCNSHAALVLSNLAFGNQEIKDAVGEHGGLAAISAAMRMHGDYQPMQARGSLALRNLCYNSEKNQQIAGETGAAEALLKAIQGYMSDREVAHQSCIALANMSNLNEENRAIIIEAGGASIIHKLLQKYRTSATVNDDCISIIRNICVGHEAAAVEIGNNGGVQDIIHAMQTFKSDSKMVEKGCAAIRYLCFAEENRKAMGANNGLETIVTALKENDTSESAVENALLAIGNATFNSSENKAVVGRSGGIQAIVKAVEGQRLNERIQEHGCRVLRNLADGFEFNRRVEVESGAINTAVFAMMGYPENASIQEQALAMLLNLAMSDSSLERLRAADVERLAEKALSNHGKNRGVVLQGGQLIDRLNGLNYDDPPTPRRGMSRGGSYRADGTDANPDTGSARRGFRGLLGMKNRRA